MNALKNQTSDIKSRFIDIWKLILKVDAINIYDNFFELGGDSLSVIRLIAKTSQAGYSITIGQLITHPTIAELATVAEECVPSSSPCDDVTTINHVNLSPGQLQFLVGRGQTSDLHHWNIGGLFEISRALTPQLVEKAVEQLLLRHESLRLRFTHIDSIWRQSTVGKEDSVAFTQFDYRHLSGEEQRLAIQEHATFLQSSLRLEDGPLFRLALFVLEENRCKLFIVMHHIVADDFSMQIIIDELQAILVGLHKDESINLPEQTTSYTQWVQSLAEHAKSDKAKKELEYWRSLPWNKLRALPRDFHKGKCTNASGRIICKELTVNETYNLENTARNHGLKLRDVLLASLSRSLGKWMKADVVQIDLLQHGRINLSLDFMDLSRTVGFFLSYVPAVLNVSTDQTILQSTDEIKKRLQEAPHDGVGFNVLKYLSNDTSTIDSLSSLPQAEVLFNFLSTTSWSQFETNSEMTLNALDEPCGTFDSPRGYRNYPLAIRGSFNDKCLKLVFVYSENLHERSTIEAFACDCIYELRSINLRPNSQSFLDHSETMRQKI